MSVRLSLTTARALAVLALGACAAAPTPTGPAVPGAPSAALAALALTPDSIWLVQGDSIDLTPVGRTVDGDSVQPAVTWQATGGGVRGDGRFVAGVDTGTFAITARAAGGLAATATIFLSYDIVELLLTPETVVLPPGGTQQFTARGVTMTGDTVAVEVIWSATGGTITPNGFLTAGSSGGEILVTAELAPPAVAGRPVLFPRRGLVSRIAVGRPG